MAKSRGVRLAIPTALGAKAGWQGRCAVPGGHRAECGRNARDLAPVVRHPSGGATSLRAIAGELNARGMLTARARVRSRRRFSQRAARRRCRPLCPRGREGAAQGHAVRNVRAVGSAPTIQLARPRGCPRARRHCRLLAHLLSGPLGDAGRLVHYVEGVILPPPSPGTGATRVRSRRSPASSPPQGRRRGVLNDRRHGRSRGRSTPSAPGSDLDAGEVDNTVVGQWLAQAMGLSLPSDQQGERGRPDQRNCWTSSSCFSGRERCLRDRSGTIGSLTQSDQRKIPAIR